MKEIEAFRVVDGTPKDYEAFQQFVKEYFGVDVEIVERDGELYAMVATQQDADIALAAARHIESIAKLQRARLN